MSYSASPEQTRFGYEQLLRDAVAVATHSAADLRSFLGLLDGADPVLALATLEESASDQANGRVATLLKAARTSRPMTPSELPIAHPLDYAWLFTEETRATLIAQARSYSRPDDLIVHLGCPTVHSWGLSELPDRRHFLLDRDARRVTLARAAEPGSGVVLDVLTDPLPDLGGPAAVVVADPPWYPESAAAFVAVAANLLAHDGMLLLAFVGTLTRPDADRDLARVLLEAKAHGFEPVETRHRACRYDMPPFERAALEVAGYPGVPQDWRLGSLTVLRRCDHPAPVRHLYAEPQWIGHEIKEIPLRTWANAPPFGEQLLTPLLEGAPLPSVSRRDPRRRNATLWTSRNRIYASCDPAALQHLVSAVAAGASIDEESVVAELERLIALERAEHGLPSA